MGKQLNLTENALNENVHTARKQKSQQQHQQQQNSLLF